MTCWCGGDGVSTDSLVLIVACSIASASLLLVFNASLDGLELLLSIITGERLLGRSVVGLSVLFSVIDVEVCTCVLGKVGLDNVSVADFVAVVVEVVVVIVSYVLPSDLELISYLDISAAVKSRNTQAPLYPSISDFGILYMCCEP
jgi:hypothetical protein